MHLFIVWLFVSAPCSILFRLLPQQPKFVWMKHILSIIWCLAFYLTTFGYKSLSLAIPPILIVWIAGKYLHSFPQRKTRITIAIWIFCMLYLAGFHIHRMITYWMQSVIDPSTVQMMITIKITQFITQVYYNRHQSDNYPSFIEWLGFICFIPSFLAGPVLNFDEYKNFIDAEQKRFRDTPGIKTSAYKLAILVILYLIGNTIWPTEVLLTKEFLKSSLSSKILGIYITMLVYRIKLYGVWTIAEIGYILSGASPFVQYKGRNQDILDIECPQNPYGVWNGWNKKTNIWLKECIYLPVSKHYPKLYAILATNLVSAFWHGFYPGYYITFLIAGSITFQARMWRKQITSRIENLQNSFVNQLYNRICIFTLAVTMPFAQIPFTIYSIEHTLLIYNSVYWYGAIVLLTGWIVLLVVPPSNNK